MIEKRHQHREQPAYDLAQGNAQKYAKLVTCPLYSVAVDGRHGMLAEVLKAKRLARRAA